ncbi:MAG: C2H2-type zinc finger protein [Nitrosopumilaceae archaeon]|nr:C2H2-type zinc finger protein [Nitrosopumilaceae archaeon]
MLVIDCKDVLPIRNELLVYVSDQVAAIPTLQNNQFTLSTLDEDEDGGSRIDASTVVDSIREFLDSIGEGRNFAVIANNDIITIASVTGRPIERDTSPSPQEMFNCSHCGFVTRYETELNVHMRIHYF